MRNWVALIILARVRMLFVLRHNLSPETGPKGDVDDFGGQISTCNVIPLVLCYRFILMHRASVVIHIAALLPHFSFQELKVNGY